MARKTSPRYRTKDMIVRDITFVLNSPLSEGTKFEVIYYASWTWTELDGKIDGCPYWTEKALIQSSQIPMKSWKKVFHHEHVIPIIVVCEMLLDLKSPTIEQVKILCETFMIATVITLEEEAVLNSKYKQKMPPEFSDPSSGAMFRNPWLRYIKTGIKWIRKEKQSI
jgi:hypothetical protein